MSRKSGTGTIALSAFVLIFMFFMYAPVMAEQKPLPATDTVLVPASDQYGDPSLLNVILLGKNYRKDWSTPVWLPVFNIKAFGFTIEELGGGMQTKSLYMKNAQGEEWVLRTVDKDPRETVPGFIRNRVTVHVIQQMISAAQPYAPLTIPTLAKAAGVTVTEPKFYYVPNDPAFGKYQSVFAHSVCLLERKNVTPENIKALETKELVDELLKHNSQEVQQAAYLRARLLDMLIADWDRHQDQWLWGAHKQGNTVRYEVLPKDRDQAYFYSQGLLVKLLSFGKLKHFVGFTRSSDNIKKLNNKSWEMDRLFLNELTYKDWQQVVTGFRDAVTPEVIERAVKKLPPQIYAISGKKLTDKMTERRSELVENVLRYYRFLARKVTIHGTDEAEVIQVKGNKDSVTIYITNKQNKAKLYKRTFYTRETKSIQLLALGGNDVFNCEDAAALGIRIQVDVGKGQDEIVCTNLRKVKVLDTEMDAKSYNAALRKALRIKDDE